MTGDADSDPEGTDDHRVREPTLLDALIPTVTLISLIALTIALFGAAATDGPLQVALLARRSRRRVGRLQERPRRRACETRRSVASRRRWGRSSSCWLSVG